MIYTRNRKSLDQRGVTIVELLVVMIISSFMVIVVTAFGLNYWGQSVNLEGSQETFVSRLNSGDYIRCSKHVNNWGVRNNNASYVL
jgi:Tfp pilus assembly protein FimT